MVIRKYIGNDMNEVMTKIKHELGNDAIIVSRRRIRKSGVLGVFQKKVIEVTAAINNCNENKEDKINDRLEIIQKLIDKKKMDMKQNQSQESSLKTEMITRSLENIAIKNNNLCGNNVGTNSSVIKSNDIKNNIINNTDINNKHDDEVACTKEKEYVIEKYNLERDNLLKEIQEMKSLMNSMIINPINSNSKLKENDVYALLKNSDIEERILHEIVKKTNTLDPKLEDVQKAKIALNEMINISQETLQGKVVIVGPTGVGKTTTIAKLAGRLALMEKKKVGLITIDTYRIGAVEQLKTYADIMNIPFKVVFSMKDMENALDTMKDCDTILIDTTGRSSKNTMQISELRAFLDKVNTKNVHLVMSCTTKNNDIQSIVEGYKTLGYNNVIITKLDETTTYGSIINILQCTKKPLSFVATGQDVPDDIKGITADKIVKLILGEDNIC